MTIGYFHQQVRVVDPMGNILDLRANLLHNYYYIYRYYNIHKVLYKIYLISRGKLTQIGVHKTQSLVYSITIIFVADQRLLHYSICVNIQCKM